MERVFRNDGYWGLIGKMKKKTPPKEYSKDYFGYLEWLVSVGLPKPQQEYRFLIDRKWRFDFAWPEKKVAMEIDGGVMNQGRHNRSSGFILDAEKYNKAVEHGWRVVKLFPWGKDIIWKDKKGKDVRAGIIYNQMRMDSQYAVDLLTKLLT